MVEAGIGLGLLLGALALVALPAVPGMWGAAALTCLSMIVGVLASAVYHHRLRKFLRGRGALPRGWWLHPTPHHRVLDDDPRARERVLTPFYVGVVCAASSLVCAFSGAIFAARWIWTPAAM